MKICILAPSPVPFVFGGAEKLFLGICEAINTYTRHVAELIKLPSAEDSFWDIVDSYFRFSQFNLDHFDVVLTTKYPAWMLRHKNHHVYMQHKLRGFYDLYYIVPAGLEDRCVPSEPPPLPPHPALERLYSIIKKPEPDRADLEACFKELFCLREKKELYEFFTFPGPLIKELVHFFDRCALSPSEIRSYSAISKTVADRKEYFPDNVHVNVIYHPTPLQGLLREGEYKYIFTASRLIPLKRLHLLIKAFKGISADIPFYIAGEGPEKEYLSKIAQDDARIKLLGFVSDSELVNLYSNALFVPFIPYDEDFGYIGLEAMRCAKTVLGCTDSGGFTELIEPDESGILVPPDIDAIREAMEKLILDRQKTKIMGEKAKSSTEYITWDNFAKKLMDILLLPRYPIRSSYKSKNLRNKKRHLVVLSTFVSYPPVQGGQLRNYHICLQLSRFVDVTIIAISNRLEGNSEIVAINENLREIRVPRTEKEITKLKEIEEITGVPSEDVLYIDGWKDNPFLIETLKKEMKYADLVLLSHPYLFYAAKEFFTGPIIYDANNVEFDLKKQLFKQVSESELFIKKVEDVEKRAVLESEIVFSVSPLDKKRFIELYGIENNKVCIIPNGFDDNEVFSIPEEKKRQLRKKLKIDNFFTTFFIGSGHPPNIEAAMRLNEIAEDCPSVLFLLAGSLCFKLKKERLSPNVILLNILSNKEKGYFLNIVDIALNPVTTGSGTNLKTIEYLAFGCPTLSTPFGIRGLSVEDYVILADIENFASTLNFLKNNNNREVAKKKAQRAQYIIKKTYSWSSIGQTLEKELKKFFSC